MEKEMNVPENKVARSLDEVAGTYVNKMTADTLGCVDDEVVIFDHLELRQIRLTIKKELDNTQENLI